MNDDGAYVQIVTDRLLRRGRNRSQIDVLNDLQCRFDDLSALALEMPEFLLKCPASLSKLRDKHLAADILNGVLFGNYFQMHEPTIHAWLNAT